MPLYELGQECTRLRELHEADIAQLGEGHGQSKASQAAFSAVQAIFDKRAKRLPAAVSPERPQRSDEEIADAVGQFSNRTIQKWADNFASSDSPPMSRERKRFGEAARAEMEARQDIGCYKPSW